MTHPEMIVIHAIADWQASTGPARAIERRHVRRCIAAWRTERTARAAAFSAKVAAILARRAAA